MILNDLEKIIIKAKQACYVGNAKNVNSSRILSHDLEYNNGLWSYRDSYFGSTDFVGQEVVWYDGKPVWAMNYYGRIIRDDIFNAEMGAMIIKKSLSKLYAENRFLGEFSNEINGFLYVDTNKGDFKNFIGKEVIKNNNIKVYELDYHGGLIRE
jgi:hypothetical protein